MMKRTKQCLRTEESLGAMMPGIVNLQVDILRAYRASPAGTEDKVLKMLDEAARIQRAIENLVTAVKRVYDDMEKVLDPAFVQVESIDAN